MLIVYKNISAHKKWGGFPPFPACFLIDISSETNYSVTKISLEAIRNKTQEETAGCKPCSALWKGQSH